VAKYLKELSSSFNILKKNFPDYEDLLEQREMAGEVLRCLKDKNDLLIEAGTLPISFRQYFRRKRQ